MTSSYLTPTYRVATRALRTVILAISVIVPLSCGDGQGIPPVCPPPQTNQSCFFKADKAQERRKVIIFVHGVFGEGRTSWGAPSSQIFWPAMVAADKRFADFDIFLLNYLTPYSKTAPNIHETASAALSNLNDLNIFKQYREIHFIAHSMGGLVVKAMLVQLNSGVEVKQLRQVRSVVFLSTPAQGASIAELASWFSITPQLDNMARAHLNAYIQSLEDAWTKLMNDRVSAKTRYPQAFCAYETQKTLGALVVPRELATTTCDRPLRPMPFNHFTITTVSTPDQDPYLWTMARILEVGEEEEKKDRAASLLNKAKQLKRAEQRQEALATCDNARALYKAIGDRVGEARVLVEIAELEEQLDHRDEAREIYIEARNIFKSEGDRQGEADVLLLLGHLEELLDRRDQAHESYIRARAIYKDEGNRGGEASVLTMLGALETLQGRTDEARKTLHDARQFFHEMGYPDREANVLLMIGQLENSQGHTAQASQNLAEAGMLYTSVNDRLGEANAYAKLGDVNAQHGRTEKAEKAYKLAQERFISLNDRLGQAHVLRGLGDIEAQKRHYQLARDNYVAARSLYKGVGDRLGEANALRSLGQLDAQMRRIEDARDRLKEALFVYKDLREDLGQGHALLLLGRVEAPYNRELAHRYFSQAAAKYDDVRNYKLKELALEEAKKLAK
jgi:tetratricopeptide (TPR) repeat protein